MGFFFVSKMTWKNKTLKRSTMKTWRERNKSKVRGYVAAFRKKNPDYQRGKQLGYKYGITIGQYDEIMKSQKGLCAICLNPLERFGRLTHVDHNHQTNKVRGLLCRGCNLAIGIFKDDADIVQRASAYLRDN